MKTPKELREEASRLIDEAEKIDTAAKAEGRELTEEEDKKILGLLDEADQKVEEATKIEAETTRRRRLQMARQGLTPAPDRPLERDEPTRVPATARDTALEARHGFRSSGEYFQAIHAAGIPGGRVDNRLVRSQIMDAAGDSMRAGQGESGGFLLAPTFRDEIYEGVMGSTDSLMADCDSFPIDAESVVIPAKKETARTRGSLWGGARAYWHAEGEQLTESRPRLRRMEIRPRELYCLVYVEDKLLRNAPATLGRIVRSAAADAINFEVGDAVIRGEGGGKPQGVMNSLALVTVSKEGSQAADTVLWQNILKMYSRMPARIRSGAAWYINQDIEPQLFNMAFDPAATSKVPIVLANGTEQPVMTILGRPVKALEYASTLGDLGDIIFGNFKAYALGFRAGIEEAMSIHVKFDYAQTAFRFLFEVDGQSWLDSAITPANGTATLSPFVTLEARA